MSFYQNDPATFCLQRNCKLKQIDFQIHVTTGLAQTAAQVLQTNVKYGESVVWPKSNHEKKKICF